MEVFWEHGFERTSMENLLGRMKINRGSLYDTFGDKHSPYSEALTKYRTANEAFLLEILRKNLPIERKIQGFS